VIGGGPAGLMAAEAALAAGVPVDLFEAKGSVGRKFLIAGRGGLNLTHSDPPARFASRYGERATAVADWLREFDNDAHRRWAEGLGISTFVGSSGRIFPQDMKAAPLLRAWLRRLREAGLRIHARHVCRGWNDDGQLRFATESGEIALKARACVLALGGGSWPQLGSDGAWMQWLGEVGAEIAPLQAANCGFDLAWSEHFRKRFAGQPVKPAWLRVVVAGKSGESVQGEFVVTETGIEGSLVYALSAQVRDALRAGETVLLELDLTPKFKLEQVRERLAAPSDGRSLSEILRRRLGLDGVRAGLVHELVSREALRDPSRLAGMIKALPLRPLRPRPIAEAISSAGGVRLECMDTLLMLRERPGVFCAGEMLDWEAPTGGYLLAASFASGRRAGAAAATWLQGAGSV
jgi:uncharacterized flavoprotein (TIGR03862 family)